MTEKSSRNVSHRSAVERVRDAETFAMTLPGTREDRVVHESAFDLTIVGSGFGGSLLAMIARRLGLRGKPADEPAVRPTQASLWGRGDQILRSVAAESLPPAFPA